MNNDANSTEGGYIGANDRGILDNAMTIISGSFTGHRLVYRGFFTNAVTNGYPSAGAWYTASITIPNEPMMYGSYIFAPGSTGSITPKRNTIDTTQLAAITVNPVLICPNREWYWLRDVVNASQFSGVYSNGAADVDIARQPRGIRPVFGLVG